MPDHRYVNDAALDLIEHYEGCKFDAYQDVADVWTIGYGHTGPDVFEGETITVVEAEQLLDDDLFKFERFVSSAIGAAPTTVNQFGAMVSLCYNIGEGAFSGSTVLREHRAGNANAAANAFLLWVKAGGKVYDGLVKRRQDERALYLTPDVLPAPSPTPPVPPPASIPASGFVEQAWDEVKALFDNIF